MSNKENHVKYRLVSNSIEWGREVLSEASRLFKLAFDPDGDLRFPTEGIEAAAGCLELHEGAVRDLESLTGRAGQLPFDQAAYCRWIQRANRYKRWRCQYINCLKVMMEDGTGCYGPGEFMAITKAASDCESVMDLSLRAYRELIESANDVKVECPENGASS